MCIRDRKYTDAAMRHIRAWFIDQKTMMNPNLLYAQAIKGIATGRGIGIIDTIHLIEVAQSLRLMEAQGIIEDKELQTIRLWFSDYLTWLSTHRYGINAVSYTHLRCNQRRFQPAERKYIHHYTSE